MVDPAGGSFVLRYARVISAAVQIAAEFARMRPVTDRSTEQTNRHRASDPTPRTNGPRDRVQPATRDGARRTFHAEIDPRRLHPRCSGHGHQRALGSKSP